MDIKHRESSYLRAYKAPRPSTFVESALQIRPFYAKQTQSQVGQNERKLFCDN